MEEKKKLKRIPVGAWRRSVDKEGNVLISRNDYSYLSVSLKLVDEYATQDIGNILKEERVLIARRKRENAIGESYPFPYRLLKESKRFDTIRIIDDMGTFEVGREYAIAGGHLDDEKEYNEPSYRQLFYIPISIMNKVK